MRIGKAAKEASRLMTATQWQDYESLEIGLVLCMDKHNVAIGLDILSALTGLNPPN